MFSKNPYYYFTHCSLNVFHDMIFILEIQLCYLTQKTYLTLNIYDIDGENIIYSLDDIKINLGTEIYNLNTRHIKIIPINNYIIILTESQFHIFEYNDNIIQVCKQQNNANNVV